MLSDILRGELERLFELDELADLSRDLLGFDPGEIGGLAAKGSFAGALTAHCVEHNAVEALCEVLLAIKDGVDPRVREMRDSGMLSERALNSGEQLGDFRIARPIGKGPVGRVYLARAEHKDYRLKVLRPSAARDRRGLHRYLTLNRLIGRISHPGLPQNVQVGQDDEQYFVVHDMVDGQTLAARMAGSGPIQFSELEPLLLAVLRPLEALHSSKLSHGDLHLDNIIVASSGAGEPRLVLVDAGCDRLLVPTRLDNGSTELFSTPGSPATVSPEQIRGQIADARSDVYSFGAVMYQLLSGRPVFAGSPLESAFSHLRETPTPLCELAAPGWISSEIELLVQSMLAKDPGVRPRNATEVLELLHTLGRSGSTRPKPSVDERTLTESIEQLLQDPLDGMARQRLEDLVEQGASPVRVAEAFSMAADIIEGPEATPCERLALLLRSARLYEASHDTLTAAEKAYRAALELAPDDELVLAGLEEVHKRAGHFEELIELLLSKNDRTKNAKQRSENFAEIGRIYDSELHDTEQALVAYTQAFVEDPNNEQRAIALEQAASGGDGKAWEDALASLAQSQQDEGVPRTTKLLVYLKMALWYQTHLQRFDLATSCLENALAIDSTNDTALAGLTEIYRRSQQWRELGATLSRRAASAPAPLARDLRTEAGELLEHQLADTGGARDLYQRVIDEDPGHVRAVDGLSRICERAGDYKGLAKLLRRQGDAQRGRVRERALCRLAEIADEHLEDPDEAVRAYKLVLAQNPSHIEALRGIDRVLSNEGRHRELLEVLFRELELASTPRQKIQLYRRVGSIYADEFLDHEKAAQAQQQILQIDRADQLAMQALVRHYRALERWSALSDLYEKLLQLQTEPNERIQLALTWGRLLGDQLNSPESAARAYELVLEVDPKHEVALDALARLKEKTGDASAAVEAIVALADKAHSAYEKSQQFLRAANLLRKAGDLTRAIEHYKHAVDAAPDHAESRASLRAAYIENGDHAAAMKLIEREIELTEGERAKAKLASEMALLARDGLKDEKRAEAAAKRALEYDPTDPMGLILVFDLAFDHQRYLEAAKHSEAIARRIDGLPPEQAQRVLLRAIEALYRADRSQQAQALSEALLKLANGDLDMSDKVARLALEHDKPERAVELYRQLFARFGADELAGPLHYRYGEALGRVNEPHAALRYLERASELCPEMIEALEAQAKIHEKLENWQEAVRVKQRQLDLVDPAARAQLHLDLAEIAVQHSADRAKAVDHYLKALEQQPNERRALTKLMQFYSEEEAWDKLVKVVLELAKFVEAPAQKAKYLETAAVVTAQQIGDVDTALSFYERAFELQPSIKAIDEAIELYQARAEHIKVERLLRARLNLATESNEQPQMLATFVELGELYEQKLGDIDNAIDAYEAAHTLDPLHEKRGKLLSELYATDPKKYLDRGIALHARLLQQDPQRVDSYRMLRRLYTEAENVDASWCLCRALSSLKLASDDEARFYERLRSDTAAAALAKLSDEDWLSAVLHPRTDPLVTSVFALIEPAVIEARSESAEDYGYTSEHLLDLGSHYAPLCQSLQHAAATLGVPPPPTYENTNDPGGLSFLHAFEPSIVLGNAALGADVPSQAAAFIAAHHLSYLRPGLYLRQLIGTGTGLKSWLFAAIKLTAPGFPVAPEMEGPIGEAMQALRESLQGKARDHLTRVVSKMIKTGAALDLKSWIAGVDLTADRAGFILADDLETALEILAVSDESASSVSREEREKELILYSVSPQYLVIRKKLGIAIKG